MRKSGSQSNSIFGRRSVFFPGSLLGPVVQAQLSSIIACRLLALDIQVFACNLVGEAEKVSVAG